jgi:hypothetical protein
MLKEAFKKVQAARERLDEIRASRASEAEPHPPVRGAAS